MLGVIGAGQLARMMVAPAIQLGVTLRVFANSSEDSAAQIVDHVLGDYRSAEEVLKFAQDCDVLTFEHELIPESVIRVLEGKGITVRPSANAFKFSQDKAFMRQELSRFEIAGPRWQVLDRAEEVSLGFPLIAKSISGGYDGKGVWVIEDEIALSELLAKAGKLLIEEKIDFDYEIAVMVSRSPHGQAATWSPTLTIQKDGICIQTITPPPQLSESLLIQASGIALKIAKIIGLVGVMAVEMFVIEDRILVNEVALRPHNSGHWTIEGSITNQFEQHIRAVLDLPLGETSMRAPYAVMGNVIGGQKTDMYRPYLHLYARNPEIKIHQYRKSVRPGRKVGHVTAIGNNLSLLQENIEHAVAYMNGEIDE